MVKPLFVSWLLAAAVCACTAGALGQTGSPSQASNAAVDSYIAQLKNDNPAARVGAAQALGAMGPGAQAAVPALVDMLGGKSNVERIAAAFALARIGPAAKGALPALKNAASSGDDNVRKAAEAAIEAIEPSFLTTVMSWIKSPYVLTALLALGAGAVALFVMGGFRRNASKIPEAKWREEQARAQARASAPPPAPSRPKTPTVPESATPPPSSSGDRTSKPRARVSRPLPGLGNYVQEQRESPESVKRDYAREQDELKRISIAQEELADQYDMEDPKKEPDRVQGLRRQIEEYSIEHYRTEVRVKALEIKVIEALLGDGKTADSELRGRTDAMLREKWEALRTLVETPAKIVYRLGQWSAVPNGPTTPVPDVRTKLLEFGIVMAHRDEPPADVDDAAASEQSVEFAIASPAPSEPGAAAAAPAPDEVAASDPPPEESAPA